ncbi:MAG: hypothetical protein JRK53_20870 [Deltaproteobacteria bacterium]|nr:hypothetical protein [Deltaproteobacteria bacterium]
MTARDAVNQLGRYPDAVSQLVLFLHVPRDLYLQLGRLSSDCSFHLQNLVLWARSEFSGYAIPEMRTVASPG